LSAGQPWEHTALLIEARKVQDTDTYSLFSVVTTSQGRLSLSTLPAVLVKVHAPGSEDLVDHEQEIRAIDYLAQHEHAGELFGVFGNGYICESLAGKIMSLEELREPVAAALVAEALATFHSLPPPPHDPVPWHGMLDQWISTAKQLGDSNDGADKIVDSVEAELATLKVLFSKTGTGTDAAFCHNNATVGNIVLRNRTRTRTAADINLPVRAKGSPKGKGRAIAGSESSPGHTISQQDEEEGAFTKRRRLLSPIVASVEVGSCFKFVQFANDFEHLRVGSGAADIGTKSYITHLAHPPLDPFCLLLASSAPS
jgi:hypothetical protein